MDAKLLSVGDCPLCPGFGLIMVLAHRNGSGLIFFCPACYCAWRNSPEQARFDEVNRLEDLAPDGVRLPQDAELRALSLPTEEFDSEPWESDLREILAGEELGR